MSEPTIEELEAELAAQQAYHDAMKAFQVAQGAYFATFPGGLDHFAPDMELAGQLDFCMHLSRATLKSTGQRLKEARIEEKRRGPRVYTRPHLAQGEWNEETRDG